MNAADHSNFSERTASQRKWHWDLIMRNRSRGSGRAVDGLVLAIGSLFASLPSANVVRLDLFIRFSPPYSCP